jgi:hypothetical protein
MFNAVLQEGQALEENLTHDVQQPGPSRQQQVAAAYHLPPGYHLGGSHRLFRRKWVLHGYYKGRIMHATAKLSSLLGHPIGNLSKPCQWSSMHCCRSQYATCHMTLCLQAVPTRSCLFACAGGCDTDRSSPCVSVGLLHTRVRFSLTCMHGRLARQLLDVYCGRCGCLCKLHSLYVIECVCV